MRDFDCASTSDGLPLLHAAPGHLIRCAQQINERVWLEHVGTDLTSMQYGILLVLGARPDIDQRTLGDLTSVDKSTVADVLRRLARRDLVSRHRDPADGRRNTVRLTRKGRDTLFAASPGAVRVQDEIFRPLSFAHGEGLLGLLRLVAYRGVPPAVGDPGEGTVEGWPLRLPPVRLHTAPGHLIRRAQQVHTNLWNETVTAQLTSVQYNVLLVLHHEPGIDQRTLGEHASLDKSTGGDVIGRLQSKGLIARSRDTTDARRNVLRLSKTGRREVLAHAAAVVEVQREILRPLDASQRRDFVSLMTRIGVAVL
jgi:DNA-binding MarR family transcriptional regulator